MENLEIKARCASLAAMARTAAAAGAVMQASFEQVDTYFKVAQGRLKLRRQQGAGDALIFYRRPDDKSAKVSRYEVVPVCNAPQLEFMLQQALGIKAVVRKRRQLWRLDNIRIHLDEVEGLGSFIEFEVEVGPGRDVAGCRAQADALLHRLGISAADLIAGSYSDLAV
jgi:adenylate cyclase class 2